MPITRLSILLAVPLALLAGDKKASTPRPGVKTPGVQIPIASLKAEAEIPAAAPLWIGFADMLLIPNTAGGLDRLDPKTNKLDKPVAGIAKPCGATVTAFGSIWSPSCGDRVIQRIDPKKWEVTAKVTLAGSAPQTHSRASIAATADSIWAFTDNLTTLSRIDPKENQVVGELRLPAGCTSLAFGETSLWAACASDNRVLRINPETNLVDKRIEVSSQPVALVLGEGSVWVLCVKDGKVDRIDPKTNKVSKSIELLVPGAGGIAIGAGSVWVTQDGFPLTRIDPVSEKVVQQFWGAGGGAIQFGVNALWLSNLHEGTLWRIDPKRVLATLAE